MDITATLLHCAGCQVPDYMDSKPLADLGIPNGVGRDRVFGFVTGGSMNYDGSWKLARYSNGYAALFNVDEDPGEQNNRIDDSECQDSRSRLDAELTTRIIESINASHIEKAHQTSWEDPVFCQGEGRWNRVYPNPIA